MIRFVPAPRGVMVEVYQFVMDRREIITRKLFNDYDTAAAFVVKYRLRETLNACYSRSR